jgi:hypothetical protein
MEFADVLRGATSPHNPPPQPGVIWMIPEPEVKVRELILSRGGLYSWVVDHMYARKCVLLEPKDVGEFLGVGSISRAPNNLRRDPKLTDSLLYTPELREMVWEADKAVATRLGYDKLR